MKVYLAARFSLHAQMRECRTQLQALGHTITSTWIDIGREPPALTPAEYARLAALDIAELRAAELVLSFTERPESPHGRGGRHTEFGIAWAIGKRLAVVGYRENIFHWLPSVEFYPTWDECLTALGGTR